MTMGQEEEKEEEEEEEEEEAARLYDVVGGPRPNPDCPKSARMASYMQAACSLAVKQNGNLILDLNISTVIPHQSPK